MTTNQLADLFDEFAQRLRRMGPIMINQKPLVDNRALATEKEMAVKLKLSYRHLIELRKQRVIPFIQLGRLIRYNLAKVEAALEKFTIAEVGSERRRRR